MFPDPVKIILTSSIPPDPERLQVFRVVVAEFHYSYDLFFGLIHFTLRYSMVS